MSYTTLEDCQITSDFSRLICYIILLLLLLYYYYYNTIMTSIIIKNMNMKYIQ